VASVIENAGLRKSIETKSMPRENMPETATTILDTPS
jgi:hypothetical protein